VKALIERDKEILNITCKQIVKTVTSAPKNPDSKLSKK
jgi:hypothetical protein